MVEPTRATADQHSTTVFPVAGVLRFNQFEVDLEAYELRHDGSTVAVEPQVFEVLALLVQNAGELVTKERLLDEVWGDRFVSESALTSRIKLVRHAIGDDGTRQHTIKTVHGRGYRFVASVEQSELATVADNGHDINPSPTRRSSRLDIDTRYVRRAGRATAYQIVGDGPHDILFIGGFVSHLELQWEIPGFSDFLERLSEFGRLIIYDRLGTGLSDRLAPGEVSTLEDRVDEAVAVLDAAEAQSVNLVGISEGGAMSVLMAALHPTRVRSMALINSFVNNAHQDPDLNSWFLDWMEHNWGRGSVYTKILAPSWTNNPTMRQLCARYERHAATPGAARRIIENTINHTDATSLLPEVRVPSLVLHRENDQLIPIEAGETVAAGIDGARFVRLQGDDHLVFAGDRHDVLGPIEQLITGAEPQMAKADRSLRALVFADIVDSTSLAVELGDDEWSEILVRFHRSAEETAVRRGGRLVKTIGDGVLLDVPGPAGAVAAAVELKRMADGLGIEIRSGVHFAAVETIGDDVAGIGVHICARVAALAHPGEVWVSRTVYDLVAGSGLEFHSRGVHELRGASQTWELFAAV